VNELKATNKEYYESYRYTQAQRNHQLRKRKTNELTKRLIEEYNKENETDIKGIESTIKTNSRTVVYEEFKKYIMEKDKANSLLYDYYNKPILKKLNFNRYINTLKTENGIIKNMKKNYGDPNNCVVILGDYSKSTNLKGQEPTIKKRIREILLKSEYKTYLIDEYNTSKKCNKCECDTEHLKIKSNKKRLIENKKVIKKESKKIIEDFKRLDKKLEDIKEKDFEKVKKESKRIREIEEGIEKNVTNIRNGKRELWGVLHCTNKSCNILQNRDRNACLNMHKIVKSILEGGDRPSYLKRPATINVRKKTILQ
jgi:hypothetical protein